MALPSNISTGLVAGQFLASVIDGVDPDQEPDARPVQGFVTFTASVPYLPDPTASPNPATILHTALVAVLDADGYLCTPEEGSLTAAYRGVRMIATDDPDLSVQGWTWNATYKFTTANGTALSIPTHSFALPSDAIVDLTTVVKVPSSTGIGTEQAEALAASATAAAIQSAQDAADAAQSAAAAAGAAAVTDTNISALIGNPATDTAQATKALVDGAAATKLDADDAALTYQPISSLDDALAVRVATEGTSTQEAVQSIADASAAAAAGPKLNADEKGAAAGIATLDVNSKIPVAQVPDAVKTSNGAKPVGKGELVIRVEDYGAKGDHVSGTGNGTDNADALDAAYAAAKAASTFGAACIEFGRGKFRTTREWDVYRPNSPRFDLVIKGESNLTTFLIADFYGAGKALVKAHDPAGVTRCSPTTVMHMQFGTVSRSGPNPVLLDIYGHGESRLESIRFGPCNNTVMSIAALQNVRYRDIVSFYGGKHFSYKNTTGITFTTAAGNTTLTASADIFDGADAGRMLNLYGSTAAKYLISTVTDARNVVISGTTPAITATGVSGVFEPARITTVAGSNQVSANASVFTTDDIGRVIYILGAKAGPWGEALLRAKITGLVSALTVTIDVNADNSMTRTEFAVPVIDLYSPDALGTISKDSNDFKIDLLHVENYSGVGLIAQNTVFGHITDMKIHGENTPVNTQASSAQAWLDDYSGVISGELDGQATGDHRIYLCNMNDMLTFDWLSTRRATNARIFQVGNMTDPGGIAEIKSFNSYSATATGDPYDLIEDVNATPRLVFTGLVNMLGDAAGPRIYNGKESYYLPNGQFVRGPSTSSGFDQILSGQNGARTMYEDYATKKFSVGNTAGGGTSFTITDESLALVRLLIASTGAVLPGADNTQALGASGTRWAEVVATKYTMGATGITRTTGTGTPEGVVTAPVGSEYINTAGAAGAIKYGKKTGAGNTGWIAIW